MSMYQELKTAKSKVSNLEALINQCNHSFMHSAEESVTFRTSRYSPMDGIEVEGPPAYGFRRFQTCNRCGLFQRSESKTPGVWSNWEDV
jgi:hypothetical protein